MSKLRFPTALALALLATSAEARDQPNIIIFLADDMGYGDVGPYDHDSDPGTPMVTNTPVLDTMATESLTMTQFYANSSVCSPTRAALLTGRHSIRNSITGVFAPYHDIGLPASEVTIAEMLKPLGYRTYLSGKWHLGHLEHFLPTYQGFDEFYGVPYSNDMLPFYVLRNTTVVEPDADQTMLTQNYTAEAKGFISEAVAMGKPFFLFVSYTAPHIPVYVSPAFDGITGRGLYEDAMYEMDWSVGEILSHVQLLGIDQDTLTIFTSDNGACDSAKPAPPGVPDPWRWVECGSNAPYPGFKAQFLEGGVHEPFLARWPGVLPAGGTSTAVGSVLDLLPTIASITGAQLPVGVELDGRDLFDNWTTGATPPPAELHFYNLRVGTSWGEQDMRAIRNDEYKLYLNSSFQPTFLVNLITSPFETVLANNPGQVALLYDRARSFDCALKSSNTATQPIGQNIAPDATPSASSSVSCDTSACAIDGTTMTTWTSETGGSEWLSLDLAEEPLISEAILVWGSNHAIQYQLEVSSDGIAWTQVHAESAGSGGIERIPIQRRARYVRVSGFQSVGANYQLHELALYRKTLHLVPIETSLGNPGVHN